MRETNSKLTVLQDAAYLEQQRRQREQQRAHQARVKEVRRQTRKAVRDQK